jgi:hypothetical protein
LELRVAERLTCAISYSEDIGTTALLVRAAESRPISQINIKVEVVGIVLVLKGKVVAAHWIITVKSQVIELILEEDNII